MSDRTSGPADPAAGKVGVLLVNLGTPDGTGYRPMRRYLKQFLSDRRVIEINPLIWWPILNLVVLTVRPSRSGRAYAAIWNRARDESPLHTITRAQGEELARRLAGSGVEVDWAMRYGRPAIADRLAALQARGCGRILLFPLYPQYSAATTATVCDVAFDHLKTLRNQPALRVVPAYPDAPAYIDALARSVRAQIAALPFEPEVVIASFHGLPESYVARGDPYRAHCEVTVRRLRSALGWDEGRLRLTFQSRFGRAAWLQPYTEPTVRALAESGVRRMAVVMPGFVADCVETLEEIGIGVAESFHAAGGTDFATLACLNDSAEGMAVIEAIARNELMGWIEHS
jgi:ferrochelatase